MREIGVIQSGVIGPDNKTPVIYPFFGNGGATATQNGNTITVTSVNPHNIPTANTISSNNRISGYGTKVYLGFGTGPIQSAWYDNITVTSGTTFTCNSNVSQVVASGQSIANTGAYCTLTPIGITVPAKTLTVGSTVRLEYFLQMPANITSRASASVGIVSSTSTHQGFTFNSVLYNNTVTSMYLHTMIACMSNSTDSDFIVTSYGGPAGTNIINNQLSTNTKISLDSTFTLLPVVNFSGTVNDYLFIPAGRMEFVR